MTFHSSGTPMGSAEKIPRWKSTIATSAAVWSGPLVVNASARGNANSKKVAVWASTNVSRDGRRSSGNFR